MHLDEVALIQGFLAATPHRHGARMHSAELAPIQGFLAATAHRHCARMHSPELAAIQGFLAATRTAMVQDDLSAAWAAASRATGTRGGEQDT
ncbi:MAG TPA: hypothetical protein VNM16_09240 [Bacillota bacterium]|nr:hypothetical protein [Bacillota bacterium]